MNLERNGSSFSIAGEAARLAYPLERRYTIAFPPRRRRSHRLAVQDVALSRRKQGFESPWERQRLSEARGPDESYSDVILRLAKATS